MLLVLSELSSAKPSKEVLNPDLPWISSKFVLYSIVFCISASTAVSHHQVRVFFKFDLPRALQRAYSQ